MIFVYCNQLLVLLVDKPIVINIVEYLVVSCRCIRGGAGIKITYTPVAFSRGPEVPPNALYVYIHRIGQMTALPPPPSSCNLYTLKLTFYYSVTVSKGGGGAHAVRTRSVHLLHTNRDGRYSRYNMVDFYFLYTYTLARPKFII